MLFCLGLLVCCFLQLAAGQENPDGTLILEERVFTASKVYMLLQLHFYSDRALATPDLNDLYKNYLHEVSATDDRRQFDLATIEFVAELHDGHTFFWDTFLDESNNQPLGFYALPLDGRWVVRESRLDNLKPGEVISKVDGTAIEAFFLQQQRYIPASSTVARRRNLFLFPYVFPEKFTLTLEDGRQVAVDRASLSKPPQRTESRWVNPGATAYIRISSFFDPLMEEMALYDLRQFHHAKVLIIDVRNNPGGIPPERLIRALMNRPYRGWAESTDTCGEPINPDDEEPKNRATAAEVDSSRGCPNSFINSNDDSQTPQVSRVISPSRNAFQGRVILLVDGGCISACEDFVEPSKDSGRATLIGETTQGSAGAPFFYDFHNGMSLKIAVKRDYFPDGSEFEGVGIKPDVEVHTTIEDLKNGRDPVLEKALELAAKP